MTSAAMAFMRDHGVLRTSIPRAPARRTRRPRAPRYRCARSKARFGPKGVLRCVLPFTVFLKLKDIGGNVLPPYDEEFREVAMDTAQARPTATGGAADHSAEAGAGEARHDAARCGPQRAAGLAGLLLPVGDGGASAHAQHLAFVPGSVQRAGGDAQERLIEICKKEEGKVARRWSIRSTPARATPRRV